MPDLHGRLTPQGNLDGILHTIVYANNYNSLDNKPSINSVTLQGNKTASDLGLAVPADITVTSVNGETGAVVLDGTDINYDANTTVNSKLDDLQSQIDNSGVLAVNGKTGVVTLTGSDINYSAGVTLNSKIDAVEAEIPTVDYPVTSVNGETGAVVLDGTDINYDTNTTINAKIDAVQGSIPTTDNDITHYTGTPTPNSTAEAIGAKQNALKIDHFTATTDTAGNVAIPTLTPNNSVIISASANNGYCTNATASGSTWYLKVLTSNNPTTPLVSTSTTIYFSYFEV